MRTPTTSAQAWAWWESVMDGAPVAQTERPQTGFYKVRKWFRWKGERVHWSQNEWVPARIWIEPGEIDPETGELISPEQVRLEIDGRREDPWRPAGTTQAWQFVMRKPISEDEFMWLTALSPLLPKSPRNH